MPVSIPARRRKARNAYASRPSPGPECAVRIIRCGCRLSGRAGRSATTMSQCVHRVQSRMPRLHRDGQFNPMRCRHPLRHSTVRRNTVRRNRDNHNTAHRNIPHRPDHCLNTGGRKLCPRSLARRKRKVTRFPLRSKLGHRCRSILRASRHRNKTISIFSPVRRGRTAPHPLRTQALRRRRTHRATIRRLVTLLQITRSKVMRRRTTHRAPSRYHQDQSNQFCSARRVHQASLERLDRSK